MAACSKKCFLYNKDYDELWQLHNDVVFVDKKGSHMRPSHICFWYSRGIPKGVFNGPKKCPHFEDKAKFSQGGPDPK